MKTVIVDGVVLIEKTIKYYLVNGNPYHKVWGESIDEVKQLAPEGSVLVFVQSEKILVE